MGFLNEVRKGVKSFCNSALNAMESVPVLGELAKGGAKVGKYIGKNAKNYVKSSEKAVKKDGVKGFINNTFSSVGQTVAKIGDGITSSVAGVVAKAIGALFISSKLGQWLQEHSIAGTVFCLVGQGTKDGTIYKTDGLEKIVNDDPMGLIFTNNHMPTFHSAMNDLQNLFLGLSICIFFIGLIFAAMKLPKSAIFNSPEDRREFIEKMTKFFTAWVILAFFNQILEIVLQFDGTILLAFQKFMLSIPVGSGKNATTLWQMALSMGTTIDGMSKQLANPGGFVFTLLYFIINIATAMGVYAYYIWREAAFVILWLLAYIQIPSMMLDRNRSGFSKWIRAMFGVIFIQDVHAFVITLMSIFFKCAYEDMHGTFGNVLQNFGIMVLLGVVLMMFEPLTRVICTQLDMHTSMTETLNNSASSSARQLLAGHQHMEENALKGVAGGVGIAAGLLGKGKAAMMLNRMNKQKGKQATDAASLLDSARQQRKNNRTMNRAEQRMKEGKKKIADSIRGMTGDLSSKMNFNNNDSSKSPHNSKDESINDDGLGQLKDTEAGGVINDTLWNKLKKPASLGFAKLSDMVIKNKKAFEEKNSSDHIKNGKSDARAKTAPFNNDIQGDKARTDAKSKVAKDTQMKPPTESSVRANELRKWASGITNNPIVKMSHADPMMNGTSITNEAIQMKSSAMHDENPNTTSEDVERQFAKEANEPDSIRRAMDSAINDTVGNIKYGYVPVKPVMSVFKNNLRDLGYSEDAVNKIVRATGVSPEPKDGDIGRDTSFVNNGPIEPNNPTSQDSTIIAGQNSKPKTAPNSAYFDLGEGAVPVRTSGFYSNRQYMGNEGSFNHITPEYLADNLVKTSNGEYEDGALTAHVTNSNSYITAKMNDGTEKIVSGFGQGNPELGTDEMYTKPLRFVREMDGNGKISPIDDQGFLHTRQGVQPITGPNEYVNDVINAFNKDKKYGNTGSVIPAANGLVDKMQYTMGHIGAEKSLSDYAITGDRSMSYVTAIDNNTGQRVRLSPPMKGISSLNQGVSFSSPLRYHDGILSMDSNSFTFGKGSNATNSDFQNVSDWLNKLNISDYIRQTKLNQSNYEKNHRGNLNFNTESFMSN